MLLGVVVLLLMSNLSPCAWHVIYEASPLQQQQLILCARKTT